jgi:hypothetical protein
MGYGFPSPTVTVVPTVTTFTTPITGTPSTPRTWNPSPRIVYPFWFPIPRIDLARKKRTYPSRGYYYPKKRVDYSPSVAAYQLGITMPKKYNVRQKFTGLEIRPLYSNKYSKKINNLFSFGKQKKQKQPKQKGQKKQSKKVISKINKFLLGGK